MKTSIIRRRLAMCSGMIASWRTQKAARRGVHARAGRASSSTAEAGISPSGDFSEQLRIENHVTAAAARASTFRAPLRQRLPMGALTLYTFPGNTHALQTLIAAQYNGVEIAVPAFEMGKDNQTASFTAMSPLGKVPVLLTAEGPICEAAAIARYVARARSDTGMYGSSFYEAGCVDQWVEFAKNELDLPVGMWVYPLLGFIPSDAKSTERAKKELSRALGALDAHLSMHTYLASEAITLADIVVSCSLLNAFKLVFDAKYIAPFPSVVRWFSSCVNQPEFLAVLGPTKLISGDAAPAAAP